ncbi:Tetratricopeptide (TPR) repeat [Candidatus Methanophagaceae archaeon]|nr:Tetratricopeptide (TPR) repeat [Methanophagales archaeon]
MDDLAPVIELYHHTVKAGKYDDARDLYRDRLADLLYYNFGAYQTIIELLRALFPDGEDKLPRLKKESDQAWTLNSLANSHSLSGRSRGAISLFEMSDEIFEKQGYKKNLAAVLRNCALDQMRIGELKAAEATLMRHIEIWREIKYAFWEAVDHRELGLLQIYFGKFEEAKVELSKSTKYNKETNRRQGICVDEAYRALCSLLMSNAEDAFKYAEKARELADVEHYEIDFVQAEWLLGAAYLMKGNFVEAEEHLTEALNRDRKINLVDVEPDILLEFAKLRFKQNHKKEALKHAEEALLIADRCEYRLKQVDIHNFLAEFYLDAGELEKAREHVEIAKERAMCGYKPALEKAEKLMNAIELR